MRHQELTAWIDAEGRWALEWSETAEKIDGKRAALEQEVHRRHAESPDAALFYLGFADPALRPADSLEFFRTLAALFIQRLRLTVDLEALRDEAHILSDAKELRELSERAPPMPGVEHLNAELLGSCWERLNQEFRREIKKYKGSVEDFLSGFGRELHVAGRVYFHLAENKGSEAQFAFLATYADKDAMGKTRHLPIRHALEEYGAGDPRMLALLSSVQAAARESAFIAGLLESGELFHPIGLTPAEAHVFLKEIPLYEKAGVLCRIPDWWQGKKSGARLAVQFGAAAPSRLGMKALLDFKPVIKIGDALLSEEEARELLALSDGLVFIKGRWAELDAERLKQVLDACERAREFAPAGLAMGDALRLELQPEALLGPAAKDVRGADAALFIEFENGAWLASVLEKLKDPEKIGPTAPPAAFRAQLRPYQQKGLDWLLFLHGLQFGACLADDMGLGKTIQLLAFLSALKDRAATTKTERKKLQPNLLVVPASLIANWSQEIERFAPHLKYLIAHPGIARPVAPGAKKIKLDEVAYEDYDLVITAYSMLHRQPGLSQTRWDCVILDEAQAIKNAGAKQTRAAKQLLSNNRIALTGTPVENRMSDLWSLFDFLNPGLLGSARKFADFTKYLKDHPEGWARLRAVIGPYMLRRLKTDRGIIADLPEKVETKCYTYLTKKQILLYKKLLHEMENALAAEQETGIRRRGLVLAYLLKFKQLCNHPDHYLGSGDFAEADSGKFERLREICELIAQKRERLLLFTQFREMTGPLDGFLKKVFDREGLVMHGGTSLKKRRDIVARFQGAQYVPYLALTVKTGGVGLNLTSANHVVHFDRWWNPAVENQATDRAFRIGQQKNVMVHKFIAGGTVEERIDRILEDKSELSSRIVADSGENWITEMDDQRLLEMFALNLNEG